LINKDIHKLVIIDEVDNLSMTENAKNFVLFLQSILKSDTNTTMIGIANSVDLLSKVSQNGSKENEIVESKCIFGPYSERDIIRIINKKKNKFIEANPKYKDEIENLIEDKALELTAKKVSKISGDIRVAFDLIKSALISIILQYKEEALRIKREKDGNDSVEEEKEESKIPFRTEEDKENYDLSSAFDIDINNPKVDHKLILHLSNTKFGKKTIDIIKDLPSLLIVTLKSLVVIFDDK